MAADGPTFRVVLYEGRGSRPLDADRRRQIVRRLVNDGYCVSVVRDAGRAGDVAAGTMLVLGQFEDEGMLRNQAEGDSAGRPVHVLFRQIGELDAARVLELAESVRSEALIPEPGKWKPWFPVIDYSRCTHCMQCLSFCLFDVYGVSKDGKIRVQNQSNCKTDCPACSRVCPEVAILFPKYRFSPINGDEINSDDVRRQAMKVDISALLGGDIYQALRDRSERAKSRFSKERSEDRALAERRRCLEQLQKDMDIPPEVVASLPSLEEIQAKAAAAKARAEKAMKREKTE